MWIEVWHDKNQYAGEERRAMRSSVLDKSVRRDARGAILAAMLGMAALGVTPGRADDPVRDVTFSVDMGVQIEACKFDPDTMEVAVPFGSGSLFSALILVREGTSTIYSGTRAVVGAAGTGREYRFARRNAGEPFGWNESINRQFTLGPTGTPQVLPTVYFDNRESNGIRSVEFLVDLSVLEAAGTFDPNTMSVEVRGEFNRWQGGTTLAPYYYGAYWGEVTVTGWPGDRYEYQFYVAGPGAPGAETIPRRFIVLGEHEENIFPPQVFFNDRGPDVTVDMVFSVDMNAQLVPELGWGTPGKFDPGTMGVEVRGDFAGWSNGIALADEDGDLIYTATVPVSGWQNQPFEYKFYGTGPGGLGGELRDNRRFILGPGDPQELPTVYFNDQEPGDPFLFLVDVTCSVDMGAQVALGYFDPEGGEVHVRTDINSWPGYLMSRVGTSSIYSTTFSITGWTGRVVGYHFVSSMGPPEWNVNRSFTVGAEEEPVILPTVYYDDELPPVTQEYVFSVDMSGLMAAGSFNPATMGVEVSSSFQYYEIERRPLVRQGSSGIYSGTFAFMQTPGTEVYYNFYGTGENGLGREQWNNRRFTFNASSNGPVVLPTVYFSGVALPVNVTFSVDMGPQIELGRLNTNTMSVEVRGDFNGWAGGSALTRQGTSHVYSATFPLPAKQGVNTSGYFLFHVVGAGGPGTETISARYYSVAWDAPPTDLPTVYFNNQPPPTWVPVTLSVNVSRQVQLGTFNPNTMSVEVRGDHNFWAGGATLTREGTNCVYVYAGTVSMPVVPGTTNEIRYRFYGTGGLGLETRTNRTVTLAPSGHWNTYPAQNLEMVYFNDEKPVFTSTVTFSVDMGAQMAAGRFDPATQGVVAINGANFSGGGVTWPPGAGPLTRQGTSTIYSATFPVSSTVEWPTFYYVMSGAGTLYGEHNTRAYNMVCPAPEIVLPTVLFKNELPPVFVVFSVDMSAQIASGRFNPDTMGVGMDGTVNDWNYHSPSPLARVGQTAVYSARYPVLAVQGGSGRVDFLYVLSDSSGNWRETNAVRSYVLGPPGVDMVLPKVYFSDQLPPQQRTVRFAVDMGVQMAEGLFNPATAGLEVYGSINGYASGWTLARTGTGSVYTGDFAVTGDSGEGRSYRFRIVRTNGTVAESIAFRSFGLGPTGAVQVLPTAYFDNLGPMITNQVHFTVDMGVQMAAGRFQPATMGVEVRGSFNGWGGGWNLAREGSTARYSGTFGVAGWAGRTNEYKYFGTGAGGLGLETRSNRSFQVVAAPTQSLALAYFNDEYPPPSRDVTFAVDMRAQMLKGNFNPATMSVRVEGTNEYSRFGVTLDLAREGTGSLYSGTIAVASEEGDDLVYQFSYHNGTNWIMEFDPLWDGLRYLFLGPAGVPQVLAPVYFADEAPPGSEVAVNVTFSVDMSGLMGLGLFNPGTMGVEVRGAFNGWAPGSTLARQGTNAVYLGTFTVTGTQGQAIAYQFVGTGPGGPGPETIDQRSFDLGPDGIPQVLPTDYFNRMGPWVVWIPVAFSVDMAVQMSAGHFQPGTGEVAVDVGNRYFGYFARHVLAREGSGTIYSGTVSVPGNEMDTIDYQFSHAAGTNRVMEFGVSAPARSFLIGTETETQELATVFFGNVAPPPPQVTVDVTFSVDLDVQAVLGAFDPDAMGVEVRGDFNGWAGGLTLVRQGATAVYSGTFAITGTQGAVLGYKFHVTGAGGLGAELISRSVVLGPNGNLQILPRVYFDNRGPVDPDIPACPVTFSVDMSAQIALGNFDPGSMTAGVVAYVYDFVERLELVRVGTNGIYSATHAISGLAPDPVGYLFRYQNGSTAVVESAVSPVRAFQLGEAGIPIQLPTAFFNNQTLPEPEPPGITTLRFGAGQMVFDYPEGFTLQSVYGADLALVNGNWNWTALQPGVHYSVSNRTISVLHQGRKVIRIGLTRP